MAHVHRVGPLAILAIGLVAASCTSTTTPLPAPAPKTEQVTAVRLPAGAFPRFLTVTPDGTVWCSESSGESIARIGFGGSVSHIRIPGSSNSPAGVVASPDSRVWFTGFQLIGKINVDGSLSGWRTGSGEHDIGLPKALTVGNDNAIWYTNEAVPPSINRISPTGSITELPIPTDQAEMPGITTGPDGALWFTEIPFGQTTSHAIARMTVEGHYTRWPVPGQNPGPRRITPGPDGALWFTQQKDKIGRITTDGAITEFTIPAPAFDITANVDGTLWFSTDQKSIGRITTTGHVTMYPIPKASRLIGIAAAPDGTLWTADGEADTIWHLTPPH